MLAKLSNLGTTWLQSDFFLLIFQEDIKVLCAHIVENHLKAFDVVDYVPTFKALKMRYEQQQDRLKEKPVLDR
jgi:protein phosphatase-4 regulatory subunit 3